MTLTATLPELDEIQRINNEFEDASAEEILVWGLETYGPRIVTLSSFGASSGALLHMLAQIDNTVPVTFLQTHFHFDETLRHRDLLADKYGLTVENWEVWGGRPEFLKNYGENLNQQPNLIGTEVPEAAREANVRTGIDLCCWFNKVEPMQRALRNRDAYITSLRRDGGSEFRARTQIVEVYQPKGREKPLVKINPLANWDKKQLWKYIHQNGVPVHELFPLGYKSIGCKPCTTPVGDDQHERAGRWSGIQKLECGIHTTDQPLNYSI